MLKSLFLSMYLIYTLYSVMSTSFLSALPFFPQCGQWKDVRSMQYLSSIVAYVNQLLQPLHVKCQIISLTALNIVKVFSLVF
jgi:anthranilate phosphoribosyltransferase